MDVIMASSPHIVYDTDFQTNVLDVAQTAGYALPSKSLRIYLNKLMKDMKNIGFYSEMDTFVNFNLRDTSLAQFAMVDWKKTGNIYTPNGGLVSTNSGFEGNGVNAYISTNFNPSIAFTGKNYMQNDAGRGIVVYKASAGGAVNILDGHGAGNNRMEGANTINHRINSGSANLNAVADLTGTGLKSINRDTSMDIRLYNKSVEISRTATSSSIANRVQEILRVSDAFYGDAGISCYWMGGSISNTITQNFRTVYNQYLARIGQSQIA